MTIWTSARVSLKRKRKLFYSAIPAKNGKTLHALVYFKPSGVGSIARTSRKWWVGLYWGLRYESTGQDSTGKN